MAVDLRRIAKQRRGARALLPDKRWLKVALAMGALAAAVSTGLSGVLTSRLAVPTGVTRSLYQGPGFQGRPLASSEQVDGISLDFIAASADVPQRFFSVQWDGYWYLPDERTVDLYAGGDDRVVVLVDGEVILERDTARSSHTVSVARALQAGLHHLEVRFEQYGGAYSMNVQWALAGNAPRPFREAALFPTPPAPAALRVFDRLNVLHRVTVALWMVVAGLAGWPLARPIVGLARDGGRRTLARYQIASWQERARPILALLAGASYLILVVRWFGDPGRAGEEGLPLREHLAWPLAAATLAFVLFWLWLNRARVGRMAREGATALLDRYDAIPLVLLTLGVVAYNLPAFSNPAAYLDSDSALHGIAGKHIWDGLVAPPFVYGRLVLGTLSSHVLAGTFAIVGPSVAGLVVLSRAYWWVFVVAHYALLRFGFGRVVAVPATAWLAFPGGFMSWHITYTEFGELFAFGGLAMLAVAARLTERFRDNLWYGLAGLALGLAFWGHPQTVIVGAAVVTVMLAVRGVRHVVAVFPWLAGGAMVGALPGLVGWGRNFLYFLSSLFGSPDEPQRLSAFGERLIPISREAFPVLFLGHWQPVEVAPAVGFAMATVVIGSGAWGLGPLWHFWRSATAAGPARIPSPEIVTRVLLGAIVLAAVAGFMGSRFGDLIFPPRRLILLDMAVPGLVAAVLAAALARLPARVAAAAVAAVMTAWIVGNNGTTDDLVRNRMERGLHLESAIATLRSEDVSYCEAPYWTAYWLSFATLEEVQCAQYEHERDPYYRARVDAIRPRPDRAYVGYLGASGGRAWIAKIREDLGANDISFRDFVNPQFEIILPRAE